MDNTLQFRPEDRLQKTWIPEGTVEYKLFKLTTLENNFLADFLKKETPLNRGEYVLDVGGREGDIGLKLQKPEFFHLIDPDPTLKLSFEPGKFWNERVQEVELEQIYKLIICCHVLGYLGTQNVQDTVFRTLVDKIIPCGTLALFYNTNTGYMRELLDFSKRIIGDGHYDYFDEKLLGELDESKFDVEFKDISFDLDYKTYEDLARCCWFLFGAKDQDIEAVAAKFLPKLREDLSKPSFQIDERVALVRRK
jgi:hypothetical protein